MYACVYVKKFCLFFRTDVYQLKLEVKMNKDKVKKSLKLCRDGKCNECLYNGWIREVCQKILMDDALKVIDKEE